MPTEKDLQIVTLQAIIFNNKNEVLAVQFSDHYSTNVSGKWTTPGGTLSIKELPEEGIKREVLEELNAKITSLKLISSGRGGTHDGFNRILIFYLCELDNLNIKLSFEHKQFKWLSIKEVDTLN